MLTQSNPWQCLLELDPNRKVVSGDRETLRRAIANGADLRIYTEWLFEEHVAPDLKRAMKDDEAGMLQEVIDFRETMTVGDEHACGVTTLRQSILPIERFNPAAPNRMSYFLYDLDGWQGCANLLFGEAAGAGESVAKRVIPPRPDMPKMSEMEQFDAGTTGPSSRFIYQFERYRYFVRDDWQEVFAHDEEGEAVSGSFDALHAAHQSGRDLKVAIRNVCTDWAEKNEHEVFTLIGSSWVHTGRKSLEGLSHPLVRIAPGKPIRYSSRGWDVAWVYVGTEGHATVRKLDPWTREFHDEPTRLACRWFAR